MPGWKSWVGLTRFEFCRTEEDIQYEMKAGGDMSQQNSTNFLDSTTTLTCKLLSSHETISKTCPY